MDGGLKKDSSHVAPGGVDAEGSPPNVASAVAGQKQSIDILKETKDRTDITVSSVAKVISVAQSHPENAAQEGAVPNAAVETVFTKPVTQVNLKSSTTADIAEERTEEISCKREPDAYEGRMNKLRDQSSNIFPAGTMGCAGRNNNADSVEVKEMVGGRRFMDAKEASLDCVGHIDATPRKRPSSTKYNCSRNPLTGSGLTDDDLLRGFGNPKEGIQSNIPVAVAVTGRNQDAKTEAKEPAATIASVRVPPGGHSQGLW